MKLADVTLSKWGIRYGLITGGAFIVYFLIMRVLGLLDVEALRYLNYILILPAGMWLAIHAMEKEVEEHRVNYFRGVGVSLWVTFVASAVFAVFVYIYVKILDPRYFETLLPELPFSDTLNAEIFALVSGGEPIVFGIIWSFMVIHFFSYNKKRKDLSKLKSDNHKATEINIEHK